MTVLKREIDNSRESILPLEAVVHAVGQFEVISLDEMDSVKLLDRFDTKFVFSHHKLAAILSMAAKHYRILQIDNTRIFDYQSTYYDTVGFGMYHDHHNRKLNRFKVRKREYLNTDQVFFEIKFKSNKGKTRKKRIKVSNRNWVLCKEERKFLKKFSPYTPKMLKPSLSNRFQRITLVNKQYSERVTIDLNLGFESRGMEMELPFLNIIEIKQGRSSGVCELERILKNNNILPSKFSKYCMGMVFMNQNIKYNRFKQKLIKLHKLSNISGYAPIYQRSKIIRD